MKKNSIIFTIIILMSTGHLLFAQSRSFKVHKRGMLQETIYNTGEVGRPAQITGFDKILTPAMEWPSRSATILDGIEYSGQHNIFGAGVWLASNIKGKPGLNNRLYAFCGGTGKGDLPELPDGLWSFPLSIERIENYPLLSDGSLNPGYNPDEAEEIIISSWGTNTGIKVTRTSRAWSYPDYDDFIIYEYNFEHTGDTDGNPATIEIDAPLTDVIIAIGYNFGPSFFGYQRYYPEVGGWKNKPGLVDKSGHSDLKGWFDSDYWLLYSQDGETKGDTTKAGKPEIKLNLFEQFAETGKNGGGLLSPQAAGFSILYYDTEHLAVVDYENQELNESEIVEYGTIKPDSLGVYHELDEHKRVKQPFGMFQGKQLFSTKAIESNHLDVNTRNKIYETGSDIEPPELRWDGRGAFNWKGSQRASLRYAFFGPYTLKKGDVIEFTIAEVVGYGGEAGKRVQGGQENKQWAVANSWNRKVTVENQVVTEDYVQDYGYPDYINSDVISVQDVAHKAYEAYMGEDIPYDPELHRPVDGSTWPEKNPKDGVYSISAPIPAPVITVNNTELGPVEVAWGRAVENFAHPRLIGLLDKFYVYRSESAIGPWQLLDSLSVGEVAETGDYVYHDTDPGFKVGETKYYAVTSVDDQGGESGKTNLTKHAKSIHSVSEMDKVYVVPNPFRVTSGFEGEGAENSIGFYGLPEKCTIKIYSFAGQLIQTIEHNKPEYSVTWVQISRNYQELASGVYYYVVKTPEGKISRGKFVVIK